MYLSQVIPLSSAVCWWFKLYWNLITDPKGRPLYNILINPRYIGCKHQSQARVSRETKRHFNAKGKVKIIPPNAWHGVTSSYQVHGSYAHLGSTSHREVGDALSAASTIQYFDDPLCLSVPYNYLLDKISEPPIISLPGHWLL